MMNTSNTVVSIMSIPAVHGPFSRSFEEVRIEDYIKAYSATGRPPMPCPETPASDAERMSIGLPPLFRPFPESQMSVSHLELQASQPYNTAKEGDETYESISCVLGYRSYSHEEMRCYAYGAGFKLPPTPVPSFPFVQGAEPQSTNSGLGPGEQLQNIVGQPQFSKHSPEELRVAYMRAGREVDSDELLKGAPMAAPPPPSFPSPPPPPLFGSMASSTPTPFSFGAQPHTTPAFVAPNPPQTLMPFRFGS